VLLGMGDRVRAEVQYDEWLAGDLELLGRATADPAVAADDEVVFEPVDHAHPPPRHSCLARHLVRDRVEGAGNEIAKDSHA
jgi:hypothetical protein